MLPLIFGLSLGQFSQAVPLQNAEEMRNRRITPIVKVAQTAAPAVVYIRTNGVRDVGMDWFGRLVSQRFNGEGSGVVIRKEGFIITNYHVVKGANQILVSFDKQYDHKDYDADLVSYVPNEDLALIKIHRKEDFPTIHLGRSDDLMLGEDVIAIGNPYGQTHTVTRGIISGVHRNVPVQDPDGVKQMRDLIQTDAAINSGNSGGPLLNINGELIGINSAMNVQAQNIGFAIPVDRVRSALENQLLSPETAPAWLGFEVDLSDDHLRVARVVPNSPAAKAGIQPGDCIVSVAGEKVVNQDEYRLARLGLAPMSDVELQVDSQGATRHLRFAPWDRTDGVLFERLGLRAEASERVPYARVAEIRKGSPASSLGIESGDLIEAVRPHTGPGSPPYRIVSPDALANLLAQIASGVEMEIDLYRDLNKNGRYEPDELLRGTLKIE